MSITSRNLVRHELIGLKVRIRDSTDPTHRSLSGRVIDETYNIIKIETKKKKQIKEMVIPKSNSVFIFTLPNKVKVEVDGKVLISRPEDRIKKKFERW